MRSFIINLALVLTSSFLTVLILEAGIRLWSGVPLFQQIESSQAGNSQPNVECATRFDPELLAGVTEAWFGFYNQKDIEIRVYASHQIALDEGVEPAELAVGKDAAAWQKKNPVRFDAYAVVGNVVMLCELEVASCEALIAQLD